MKSLKTPIILICFVILYGVEAKLTVMIKMDNYQLTESAKSIVIGKVLSQESIFDTENSMIYTISKIYVDEDLKGDNSSSEIYVVQPGGVANGIGMKVFGSAKFYNNEKVVVFLEDTTIKFNELDKNIDVMNVVGYSLGKFTRFIDTTTNEELMIRNVEGLEIFDKTTAIKENFKTVTKNKTTLTEFREEIYNILNESE